MKPKLGFWGLWNISFGFFGIQIGFALQNANVSRIFQTLGASIDELPILWIAGPVTGLLVQPIVGHFSDRTWGPLGRRRPYFLAGAIACSIALIAMPHAPSLWIAAGLLWLLDGSINVSMEPFRAFVGDMLDEGQRTAGFAAQTVFIGAGSVLASLAPQALTMMGVANVAEAGQTPDSVRFAFYIGAGALLFAIGWTVVTTREYSPEQMRGFEAAKGAAVAIDAERPAKPPSAWLGPILIAVGAAFTAAVAEYRLDQTLYILSVGAIVYGLMRIAHALLVRAGAGGNVMSAILSDLDAMPRIMKRLAWVQFFSWFALFILWIFTTPAVADRLYGSSDTTSVAYNEGANWVGILFAVYNGVAGLYAFALPWLAKRIGRRATHALNLVAGALGFASVLVVQDPMWLIASMIGVGMAWASILTMPYAILSDGLPQSKLGIYMGLFNIFIVLPQLVVATVMGAIVRAFFPAEPVYALCIGGGVLLVAAILALSLPDPRAKA